MRQRLGGLTLHLGGDAEAHGDEGVGRPCGLDEGRAGRVGTEVDHVEPGFPQEVGGEGDGQRVRVAGCGADHDRSGLATRAAEQRAHAADHAERLGGGPVLLGDAPPATRPPVADQCQRGPEQVEVDLAGLGAGGQARSTIVQDPTASAGHQPLGEALDAPRVRVRLRSAVGAACRTPSGGGTRAGAEGVDVVPGHPPLAAVAGGREPSGAHVAVHGHVVQARARRPPRAASAAPRRVAGSACSC